MKRRLALAGLGLLALTGCVTQPTQKDMSAFKAAAPRSILVVPVINKSLDVDAPNYVLSALPVPIAEKGYYVFPVNTTKVVLEQEGFYEGEKIHQQPASTLARLFGSDSVLYVTINRWDARYVVLSTTVTVDFSYRLVSRDDVEIWSERKQMQYTPDNNNNNAVSPMAAMLSAVLSAALTRAAPNYMPLTRQANQQVFILGPNALPDGPYRAADARR
jgi:hypothetical protein